MNNDPKVKPSVAFLLRAEFVANEIEDRARRLAFDYAQPVRLVKAIMSRVLSNVTMDLSVPMDRIWEQADQLIRPHLASLPPRSSNKRRQPKSAIELATEMLPEAVENLRKIGVDPAEKIVEAMLLNLARMNRTSTSDAWRKALELSETFPDLAKLKQVFVARHPDVCSRLHETEALNALVARSVLEGAHLRDGFDELILDRLEVLIDAECHVLPALERELANKGYHENGMRGAITKAAWKFNGKGSIAGFLRIFCEKRMLKGRSVAFLNVQLDEETTPAEDPEEDDLRESDAKAREKAMAAAFERLTPMQRAVFLLNVRGTLSKADIAALLARKPVTVRGDFRRARLALKAMPAIRRAAQG